MIQATLWFCFSAVHVPTEILDKLQQHTDNFLNKAITHQDDPHLKKELLSKIWYYTPTFKGGLGLKTLHQATHLMRLRQLQNLIKTEDSSTMNNSHTHHYIPGLDNLKHALPIWITSWKDLLFVHPTSNKPWSEIKWHKITKWWQSILFETPKKALLQMVDPLPDKSWPIWNNRYLMHNNQAIMKTTNAKNKSMIYYWASNGITHLRHVYILNTISTAAQLHAKINNAPPRKGYP